MSQAGQMVFILSEHLFVCSVLFCVLSWFVHDHRVLSLQHYWSWLLMRFYIILCKFSLDTVCTLSMIPNLVKFYNIWKRTTKLCNHNFNFNLASLCLSSNISIFRQIYYSQHQLSRLHRHHTITKTSVSGISETYTSLLLI